MCQLGLIYILIWVEQGIYQVYEYTDFLNCPIPFLTIIGNKEIFDFILL